MEYRVRAKFILNKLPAFHEVLVDGTVAKQKPDGAEIVSSMKQARITGPNTIEWFETCYCPTPLKHERETVYDNYLVNIETELVEERVEIGGDSFWSFMENHKEA
ncbi:MAG: hypothetical protein KME56_01615 [Candidatus Thiodiazotropha sp. (ex Ctena orbiculata)]|uniref:Uncharacterized protein n=1 Tax=Candidatus Thiodiazotropha taylori TaxID=2792791 RepID=A0A944M610_9GAMM|nr:hypothetical protein [Candidatus Thiodiazotropha taylori]PUB89298.1 MAG: hypothetical protein DBP00_03030 [gamma proteobacterium symbiont of Ctena orbiculata]MBT2987427.1 hypothetical protein [Candidatus Thiodiazotropha taylori]MBT2995319.1 hypothetical protein [Candidatus Thiodiazotropha taylori]MBT3001779.1 hypothetical protein [Candidatus Thiodiazotropha taylori]